MISINEYQRTTEDTAVYPECGTGSRAAVIYTAIGMAGEAGEALEFIKKLMRGDFGRHDSDMRLIATDDPKGPPPMSQPQGIWHDDFRAGLRKELGDVIWYWCRLVDELGFEAADILQGNLDKLADRSARGVIHGSGNDR